MIKSVSRLIKPVLVGEGPSLLEIVGGKGQCEYAICPGPDHRQFFGERMPRGRYIVTYTLDRKGPFRVMRKRFGRHVARGVVKVNGPGHPVKKRPPSYFACFLPVAWCGKRVRRETRPWKRGA